ncbi:MAG: diphthamide biosynthesis enzyme Dph2 [Candidatus Aenigmarchaeota archaeon]|nr:diphthamide biosynthesis enzyme Dph2 [Candidatus Aenigmarchaeota archaeon]
MEKAIQELKKLKARKIFVQFGEGLKLRIQDITRQLEREGFDVVLCCEVCFGACDIREAEAEALGCDAILHVGHEKFLEKTKLPVVYWEYFLKANPCPILDKEFDKLKNYENIGLITSIQFVKTIPLIKNYLETKGKKVFVYKALQYPGQVLGCDLRAAKAIEKKVDCFLCISAGKFYALGVIFEVEKPVLCLDLERKEIYDLAELKKKIQKIKAWNRAQFNEAKRIGLLISWKKGQVKLPYDLKKRLENAGKEVYLLAMDEITPEKLEGLKLDFLIAYACPRIGVDDLERFTIPLLNVEDII